jgi:hypothetical protein
MRGTIGNGSLTPCQHRCAPSRATAQCRKTCGIQPRTLPENPDQPSPIKGLLDLNANLSTSEQPARLDRRTEWRRQLPAQ